MSVVVNTHAYTYLRSSNHVDWSLVALENLEYLAQETCSEEHAATLDFDGCNIVLCCHSLDLATYDYVVDDGTVCLRIHGVLQANWNTCILGWLNTGRVENLGSEVSQLCCLLEVQLAYCLCVLYDTRVVVVHTIDIGPDLNLVSWESCTYERSCVVATTTLEIIYLAVSVAADEALGDVNLITFVLLHDGTQFLLDVLWVWFCILISTHKV